MVADAAGAASGADLAAQIEALRVGLEVMEEDELANELGDILPPSGGAA